jgi:dienelactone hydrolase
MKIKKKTLRIIGVIFLLIIAVLIILHYKNKETYKVTGNYFSYPKRAPPAYAMALKSSNDSYDIYAISFKTREFMDYETKIFGLLVLPKIKNPPGLVLLPGGGVTKESELKLASKIAQLGYAVLTIDQRGIGETGGPYISYEQDAQLFIQGKEPLQHLAVYDALKAYDVLRSIKGIDANNIAIAGESMGGRYALITAALEPKIKGFIGISTSGFDVQVNDRYFQSIDPDKYIKKIAPRKVYMLHGTNDSKVPLAMAERTFSLADEPKLFYTAEGCEHGYCDAMYSSLKSALINIFEK